MRLQFQFKKSSSGMYFVKVFEITFNDDLVREYIVCAKENKRKLFSTKTQATILARQISEAGVNCNFLKEVSIPGVYFMECNNDEA